MDKAFDDTSPRIQAIPESKIIEMVDLARDEPDVIKLWVGEGDLPTPDFICEAAITALEEGQTRYTYSRGIPSLREGLASYHSRLYGRTFSAEQMNVTVGGMFAVMSVFQALVDAGDEVVIPSPAWPNIYEAARIVGAEVVPVPIRLGNDGWRLDLDELFDAVTPRTRVLTINSPSNPTGWMMGADEIDAVLQFARRRGLWILTDEVYTRLTYEVDHAPSFLEICEPEDRVIAVNSFSKCWSMTGWRVGWVVAPPSLGPVYENLLQYGTTGVATFLQHGASAALCHGEDFLRSNVERCRVGRDLLCSAFGELPRVRFESPNGTFYFFARVDGVEDSRELAVRILREAKVGVAPGVAFGPGGEGHVRLCFGLSPELLGAALDRLIPFFRAL